MAKKNRQMTPVHPGEILREDLMKPLELTVTGLARELKIPVNRMSEIVNGRRAGGYRRSRPCRRKRSAIGN